MNNTVTVDFSDPTTTNYGFTYGMDAEDGGLIKMPAKDANNETWAIVLPQEALMGTGYAYSEDHAYIGTRPAIHQIEVNKFYHEGDDVIDLLVDTAATAIPLTFEAKTADASVTLQKNGSAPDVSVQYSTDGTTWIGYIVGTTGAIPLTNIGNKIMFRGTNTAFSTGANYNYFVVTGECYVYSNVMSLIDENNFTTATTLSANYAFTSLFTGCTTIYNHSAKDIVLLATTLSQYCYMKMFYQCTNLTKGPDLSATSLKIYCYAEMFRKCSNLSSVKCMANGTFPSNSSRSTYNWLSGVAPSGTLYVNPSATWNSGGSGCPSSWTKVIVN